MHPTGVKKPQTLPGHWHLSGRFRYRYFLGMNKTDWMQYRTTTRQELRSLLHTPLPFGTRQDAWTPREVLHHVLKAEAGTLPLFERFASKAGAAHPRNDGPWTIREELFSFSLDRAMSVPPFKDTDPDASVADADLDSLSSSSRWRLEEFADLGDRLDLVHLAYPHPLAGKLNYYEWLVFGVVHEWLHLRRLKSDLFPVK